MLNLKFSVLYLAVHCVSFLSHLIFAILLSVFLQCTTMITPLVSSSLCIKETLYYNTKDALSRRHFWEWVIYQDTDCYSVYFTCHFQCSSYERMHALNARYCTCRWKHQLPRVNIRYPRDQNYVLFVNTSINMCRWYVLVNWPIVVFVSHSRVS